MDEAFEIENSYSGIEYNRCQNEYYKADRIADEEYDRKYKIERMIADRKKMKRELFYPVKVIYNPELPEIEVTNFEIPQDYKTKPCRVSKPCRDTGF